MIRPPGFRGAAFSTAVDGDVRGDLTRRGRAARVLGVSDAWGVATQVHGATTLMVAGAGEQGEADALVTTTPGLPVAVFTADCLGLVVEAPRAVAVVHAGWRGLAAGVIESALEHLASGGHRIERVALGPSIGRCCYEVGDEVASTFPDDLARTTWGTTSVDLRASAVRRLPEEAEVWVADGCTRCTDGLLSYRLTQTDARMVALGWIPR